MRKATIGPRGATGKSCWLLRAALLGCLLCLLGASPAWAAPAWLPATGLSAPGRDAANPTVAMDEAGDSVAVWERQSGSIATDVQVSTRSPGAGFSAPLDLSPASSEPEVAMAPAGEAVAVWRRFDGTSYVIQAATAPPGGSFSAPVDVSSAETTAAPQGLQVALNAAGDVALVWVQKDPNSPDPGQFSVLASVRPAGGAFSAPTIVSPQPLTVGNQAESPRVAIDAAGDVTAAWDYFDGTNRVIQAATQPAGGSFSLPVSLTSDGADAFSPAVAMDSAGDAIAVWARSDGTNDIIEASTASPGGSFSTSTSLSEPGEDAGSPRIAMAPGGAATAVWVRKDAGESWIAQASTGSAAAFSSPVDLSATGRSAFDPEVAMDAAGGATAVWHRSDGANSIAQAAASSPGAGFSAPLDLSAPGEDAVLPRVAMDGAGDATAVWWRSDGANRIVQAAGYDADAPQLRNISIPSSGMVGEPVSFSVSPFDIWPIASTVFDFGDGASAPGTSVPHTYTAKGTYHVTVAASDAAGTPVTAAGTIAILPSNRFAIGRLSLHRRKGTGTFVVTVPGPGKLVLSGKGVKKSSRRVKGAGAVKLPIRARGKALERLEKRGKVRVALAISFTPDGGTTLVKHKKVTLIKKLSPSQPRNPSHA